MSEASGMKETAGNGGGWGKGEWRQMPALEGWRGLGSSRRWRDSSLSDVPLLNVQKKWEIWIFNDW